MKTPKTSEYLKQKLALVPTESGVYLHKDAEGKVLYVGKAKNLKNRLKSYFLASDLQSYKTSTLMQKATDFDFFITKNEYESLLLENQLIKHFKPFYNILLKDDKSFPYIKINVKDPWPQILLTRKKRADEALYFGPFIHTFELDKILNIIHKYFPLVKCSKNTFKTISRPCNYYDIKKCLAPCHLPVDKQEYDKIVMQVIDLLNGKIQKIIDKIKKNIQEAAEALDYEKAALLRDSMLAIQKLKETQSVIFNEKTDDDLISFEFSKTFYVYYVTHVRGGLLLNTSCYILQNHLDEHISLDNENQENEAPEKRIFLNSFLQFYAEKEVPSFILFDDDKNILNDSDNENLNKFIAEKSQQSFYCSKSEHFFNTQKKLKKDKQKILELYTTSKRNALNKLQEKIKIDENVVHKLENLKDILDLKTFPNHIECYDISTFAGTSTVGAQVVFKQGKPFKNLYRKYIIKELIAQSDDFKSLREVLSRRFKNDRGEDIDLILIDGGTPQIREVSYLFKTLGLDNICFAGIAKSRNLNSFQDNEVAASYERLVIPARDKSGQLQPEETPNTKILDPHSKAYALITEIRNETHRFAITFHRNKRDKKTIQSVLDKIEGIGAKRKKVLLKKYPNLKDILKVETKRLSIETKIPEKVIESLKTHLSED